MSVKSAKKVGILLLGILSVLFTPVHAYNIEAKFETQHYGVYQVTLNNSEIYGQSLKQIIAKDLASRKKFQSTAVGSKGMQSNIKEKMLGLITVENYDGTSSVTVNFDDRSKYASFIGIYMNFKQLAKIADNRTVNSLTSELAQVPMIIEEVPVTTVSKNYRGDLFYTVATGALVLDFQVIDSIYYDRKKLEAVTDKCKVSILSLADRYTENTPYFIGAHGAVNDITCK